MLERIRDPGHGKGLESLSPAGSLHHSGHGSSKTRFPLPRSSGGWRSKIKVLVPSESREGDSVPCCLLASAGLLAITDFSWLVDASPRSLPLSSHGVLPVCVSNHSYFQRIFSDLENFSKRNTEFKSRHTK